MSRAVAVMGLCAIACACSSRSRDNAGITTGVESAPRVDSTAPTLTTPSAEVGVASAVLVGDVPEDPKETAPAPGPVEVHMALTGRFHGGEVTIRSGAVFALRSGSGASALTREEVEITNFHDGIMDEQGEASGKQVRLKSSPDEISDRPFPLLLDGPFEEGPLVVPTSAELACLEQMFSPAAASVDDGRPRSCSVYLGARSYQVELDAIELVEVEPTDFKAKFDVTVSDGEGHRQAFSFGTLEWIGDLDRDGRLDLLTDNDFHYNVMRRLHLHLSTRAVQKGIAGKAASFDSVGC